MVCPLRRERFVHLSRKRLFESDRMQSNEGTERERKRDREGTISVTRTRDYGKGETDEQNWRKTKKSAGGKQRRRGGRGGGICGVLRKLSRNAYSKRAEVLHALMLGNAMHRTSWMHGEEMSMKGTFPATSTRRGKTHHSEPSQAPRSHANSLFLSRLLCIP